MLSRNLALWSCGCNAIRLQVCSMCCYIITPFSRSRKCLLSRLNVIKATIVQRLAGSTLQIVHWQLKEAIHWHRLHDVGFERCGITLLLHRHCGTPAHHIPRLPIRRSATNFRTYRPRVAVHPGTWHEDRRCDVGLPPKMQSPRLDNPAVKNNTPNELT